MSQEIVASSIPGAKRIGGSSRCGSRQTFAHPRGRRLQSHPPTRREKFPASVAVSTGAKTPSIVCTPEGRQRHQRVKVFLALTNNLRGLRLARTLHESANGKDTDEAANAAGLAMAKNVEDGGTEADKPTVKEGDVVVSRMINVDQPSAQQRAPLTLARSLGFIDCARVLEAVGARVDPQPSLSWLDVWRAVADLADVHAVEVDASAAKAHRMRMVSLNYQRMSRPERKNYTGLRGHQWWGYAEGAVGVDYGSYGMCEEQTIMFVGACSGWCGSESSEYSQHTPPQRDNASHDRTPEGPRTLYRCPNGSWRVEFG